MGALAWLNPYHWLMLLAAMGALTLGYFAWADHQQDIGDARATVRWTSVIEKQKGDAVRALAAEKAKVAAAEKALQDFKSDQELQDAGHQKTVAGLSARIRDLAGSAGRLRDPFATGCGGSGGGAQGQVAGPSPDRADDGAQAGWLLSPELTRFLQSKDDEADAINLAYLSCRADAYSVRSRLIGPSAPAAAP